MNAEIIAAGSELLTPARIDTNSLFLTGQLNELGVEVAQKCVIGDDRSRMAAELRAALTRSDIIIVTGGLGPTEDDVTRDATADALGRQLEFSAAAMQALEARYARYKRTMAENNRRQAFLVAGAEMLPNPNGTAPGQWLDVDGRIVLLLPGPPNEMKPMFAEICRPRLAARLPALVIRTRLYRVAGMAESDLDLLISPVYKPYANPVTTVLAAPGDIQIHLRARCGTEQEAETLLAEVGGKIEVLLGERIYSTNGDPLEVALGAALRGRSWRLAVAESCTGGGLGARVTDAPGSSEYFVGGYVTYATRLKVETLGVAQELIDEYGVVSEQVAVAMAVGARERSGAECGLSVTGEAGPESSSAGIEPGAVWVGVATPKRAFARQFRFPGNRERVRAFAAQTAMNLLRLELR